MSNTQVENTGSQSQYRFDRDGNWIDKYGACKVCDGEIPYGHTENCDIYKMERIIKKCGRLLKCVLNWCEQESPDTEIDADEIRRTLEENERFI